LKKAFSVLLTVSLLLSFALFANAAEADSPKDVLDALTGLEGKMALRWMDYLDHSDFVAGKNGTMTREEIIDDPGLIPQYLHFDLAAFGTGAGATDTQIRLRDTEGAYGFKGNIAAADVYMLHMILRSTPDDADKPMKFHLSIYGEGSSSQYVATSGHPSNFFDRSAPNTLPNTWTEYYIPVQAHETYAPDKVLMFLNPTGGTGSVDIACLEIVNYGKTITLDQMPYATLDPLDQTLSGRTVVSNQAFYHRASKSFTTSGGVNGSFTKVTGGAGMFSRYLRNAVTSVSTSYKHAQLNYQDYSKGWGLFENIQPEDAVLLHLIVRASAEDGEGSFRPYLYQQGVGSSDSTGTAASFVKQTVGNLWTEFYIPVNAGSVTPNRVGLFYGYEKQTLDVAVFEVMDFNNTDISTLPSTKRILEAGYKEAYDFFSLFEGTESEISVNGLTTAKKLTATQTVDLSNCDLATSGDRLLFSFAMKAETACTPVTITLNMGKTIEMTYYVPVQWTRYNMPVEITDLQSVTVSGDVLLAEAKFENRKSDSFASMSSESGPWLLEEFADITIKDTGETLVGKTKDLVKVDNLIYSIGPSGLTITDVSDYQHPEVLGNLPDMGSSIRQIVMLGDGKHVFISSRQNGCYVVNIEDPANSTLVSRYDSVEMATGVAAYGNYVYIANRQYGVEIVDITDVNDPVQCAIVRCGTAQSCEVADGILYAGCWNERAIPMYDVTDPANPVYLGTANLTGKGDGVTILNQGDKTYLYAATGQNPLGVTENVSSSKTEEILLSDLKLGMGNGVDIFDVTDPTAPKWLSSTKIDGRYYYADNDFWHVEVAQEQGRYYAYFLNTYNGVYVLDVTDPKAPIRLGHIVVTSDSLKEAYYSGRVNIFPYDQSVQRQSPIAGIAVEDGVLYMASILTDLHIYDGEKLADYLFTPEEKSQTVEIAENDGSFYDMDPDTVGLDRFAQYRTLGQAYTVVFHDGKYYVAAGKQGVLVLDRELKLLAQLPTGDLTIDVQIHEDTMYCAESGGGLAAYTLSEDGLSAVESWRYRSNRGVVRHVRLSPLGKYALIQCDSTYGQILSTTVPTASLIEVKANSQMYHHNILNQMAGGRYLGIYAESGKSWWFDFSGEEAGSLPTQVSYWTSNGAAIMTGGMTGNVPGYDHHVLCTRNIANGNLGGYYIYDITKENPTSIISGRDPDVVFSGRPTIAGNLLIASDRINGLIHIVDISDLANPSVLKTIAVSGNPDSALVVGDDILIPMGYQGVFRFSLSQFQTARVTVDGVSSGYDTLQEAVTASQGGYVKLMKDVTEDIVLSGDLYMDLNGKTLTGNISGVGTLYLMDNSSDTYILPEGRVTGTVSCAVSGHFKTDVTGAIRRYMVLADETGFTAHRFYLGIVKVSLRPKDTGFGYKARFCGDSRVKEQISSFGFSLNLDGNETVETKSLEGSKLDSSREYSLLLKEFSIPDYGTTNVHSWAFMELKDGTRIASSQVSYSMKTMLEKVCDTLDKFTESQITALRTMCQPHRETMTHWNIDPLLSDE